MHVSIEPNVGVGESFGFEVPPYVTHIYLPVFGYREASVEVEIVIYNSDGVTLLKRVNANVERMSDEDILK